MDPSQKAIRRRKRSATPSSSGRSSAGGPAPPRIVGVSSPAPQRLQLSAPPPSLSVYTGVVRHARGAPAAHRFAYDLALALLDVSSPAAEAAAQAPLRWLRAAGVLSWDPAAHLRARAPGQSLGDAARALAGGDDAGRVLLLTHFAFFGYAFNPVSIFYIFSAAQPLALRAVLLEVTNTPWGEQHVYALAPGAPAVRALQLRMAADACTARPAWDDAGWELAPAPTAATAAAEPARWLRFCWHKALHVSPFMPMDQAYDWVFSPPAEELRVFSRNLQLGGGGGQCPAAAAGGGAPRVDGGPTVFTTSLTLTRLPGPVTGWTLLWLLALAFPLLTQRVQAWIHVEAYRLWAKGVPLHPHPTGATSALTRVVGALAEGVVLPLAAACRRRRAAPGAASAPAPPREGQREGGSGATSI